MIIYYDGFCKMCTNTSNLWKKIDLRHKLTFQSFRSLKNYPESMEKELHVYSHSQWFAGYTAIIQITKQLPLLWPLLPFMYLLKWFGLGDVVYEQIASNRKLVPVNQCKDENCMIK